MPACFLTDRLCSSTTVSLCLLHTFTDTALLQIPCLAIKSTVRCNLRELNPPVISATLINDFILGPTPHLLLVKHIIMDAIRHRYRPHRIPYSACLSRWYDYPPYPISTLTDMAPADGLDRFEVPFFGGLASSFVDSE